MAVEKNDEIIEEEAQVEIDEQPQGLPVDITVEGEEVREEKTEDDFNAK